MLLLLGRDDAEKLEWHKDKGNRQLLAAAFSADELAIFDLAQFGKITWIKNNFESKILLAVQQVISRQAFGADSLEQAIAIQNKIASFQRTTQNDQPVL